MDIVSPPTEYFMDYVHMKKGSELGKLGKLRLPKNCKYYSPRCHNAFLKMEKLNGAYFLYEHY